MKVVFLEPDGVLLSGGAATLPANAGLPLVDLWRRRHLPAELAMQAAFDPAAVALVNGSLAGTSNRFLSFAVLEIVDALRRAEWAVRDHAGTFLERLADPGNKAPGVASIVANVRLAAWQEGRARREVVDALVRALLKANRPGAPVVMQTGLEVAAARLTCHTWRNNVCLWFWPTSHTPVTHVMTALAAPAVRARNEIAACIRMAFRAAMTRDG